MKLKHGFSYKTISKGARKGKLLNRIIDENAGRLLQSTRKIRKLTQKELNVQVSKTNLFFKQLRDSFKLFTPQDVENIQRFANVATYSELRGALIQMSNALSKAKMGAPKNYEFDHTTMIPINQSLSLTIVLFVETIQEMEAGARYRDTKVGGNKAIVNKSTQGLKTLVNELRALRFLGEKIEREWTAGTSPKDLANLIKTQKGQIDISSLKEKDLDLRDGKTASIRTITKDQHLGKSGKQYRLGGARQLLLGGSLNLRKEEDRISAEFSKSIIDEIKKVGILNITGSPAQGKHIKENLTRKFRGQATKKKKVKSSTRKRLSAGEVKIPARLSGYLIDETNTWILNGAKLLGTKVASANKSRRRDREGGERQRQLNKLRTTINARLPAKVRSNMGRPALINQTGRFSNSVQLLSLKQRGENQVAGDFTYLLAPYETFENRGVNQWPVGYDPRPLIKQSIRELAGEVAEEKFSFYLRRV